MIFFKKVNRDVVKILEILRSCVQKTFLTLDYILSMQLCLFNIEQFDIFY